jgi:hypothetical protein
MTFTRNGGEIVRKWWEERCIEWCFARFEDGKFGDQKYLDDWPERFGSSVHVLQDKERALAPWNAIRFPYGNSVFYHFHKLRIVSERKLYIGDYYIPRPVIKFVYEPYAADLRNALTILAHVKCKCPTQLGGLSFIRRLSGQLRRALWKLERILVADQMNF